MHLLDLEKHTKMHFSPQGKKGGRGPMLTVINESPEEPMQTPVTERPSREGLRMCPWKSRLGVNTLILRTTKFIRVRQREGEY